MAANPILGDARPRLSCFPDGGVIHDSGREAIEVAALAGLDLDEWQRWYVATSLTETADLQYAAFECMLICSRQNGKGGILEARELAGLFAFGEQVIVHTAHQFKTSLEAFRRILMLIESVPEFDSKVRRVSKSHGEEGIELVTGQRLLYFARSEQAGKGFTGDVLVYDEAQDLEAADVAATLPTLSARRNPQVYYMANAGTRKSTQLAKVRRRVIAGGDGSLFGAEWSCVPHTDECRTGCKDHDDPQSVRSFAKANPSLGITRSNGTGLTVEACRREGRAFDWDHNFLRERLGVGDYPEPDEEWAVISEHHWGATLVRGDRAYRPLTPVVFAVDTTPNRRMSAIAVCGSRNDDRAGVEIIEHDQGTAWLLERISALDAEWEPLVWLIDSRSQAMSLFDKMTDAGIKVEKTTAGQFAQACGDLYDAFLQGKIAHTDDIALKKSIAGVDKRDLEAAWAWDRRNAGIDLSPLIAVTLAHWGWQARAGSDYDTAESVGFNVQEVIRHLRLGTYGPGDIIRLYQTGLINDRDLGVLADAGFPVPAGAVK